MISTVVLATKYMYETKDKINQRYHFKTKLMREVLKLEGDSRTSISAVFYFVNYLLQFNQFHNTIFSLHSYNI